MRRLERTLAVRVEDRHLDVVPPPEEVGDGVELARQRVALGVCRVAALQRAAEIAGADRLELVAQLVRVVRPPRRWRRCGPAWPITLVFGAKSMPACTAPGRGSSPRALRHLGRAHPAVAVPLGPAVAQPDPVHHSVAGEPVVGGGLGGRDGIGPVAEVAAGQRLRNLAGHGEVGGGHLFQDRSEVALQVRIGGHGHEMPPSWGQNASTPERQFQPRHDPGPEQPVTKSTASTPNLPRPPAAR